MKDKAKFQETLLALGSRAGETGNRITTLEVQEFFKELNLQEEQLKLVYEYLVSNKITVVGYLPAQEEKPCEALPYTESEQNFLKAYAEDLKNIGKLDQGELARVMKDAEGGEDLAKAKATEQMLPLVLELADGMRGRGLSLEDLVQEGNVGLILAMETLGLREAGIDAETYLQGEIQKAIRDAIEENKAVKKAGTHLAEKINDVSDRISSLTEELERPVTVEELAVYMDMSVQEIENILKLAGESIEVDEKRD